MDGPTDQEALARRIPELYGDVPGLRMALITGSVARGLADRSSDLDVYLYWDVVDRAALLDLARLEVIGATRIAGLPTAGGTFEKHRLDGRFVDVESVDVSVLEAAAGALAGEGPVDDGVIKVAAGLRDATPLVGADELRRWQARLVYTDDLARAQVGERAGRLISPTALYQLTYARGDALSFAARLSSVLLNAVALLGAVGRVFVPVDDPKWLPWHIARLSLAPTRTAERIHTGVTDPTPATMTDLDALLHEILDLVDEHVPGASTGTARAVLALRPSG